MAVAPANDEFVPKVLTTSDVRRILASTISAFIDGPSVARHGWPADTASDDDMAYLANYIRENGEVQRAFIAFGSNFDDEALFLLSDRQILALALDVIRLASSVYGERGFVTLFMSILRDFLSVLERRSI